MPRPQRFLESSASPRTTDLARAFYADSQLEERMARVRQTILEVRQRWESDRSALALQLLRWLEAQAAASASAASAAKLEDQQLEAESAAWPLVLARWRAILTTDRNWADLREAGDAGEGAANEEFSVLREYTDDKSYPLVFSRVLQALRTGDDSQVLLTVYLIELINIDLFNYSRLGPPCETRVYRGLSLSEADWLSYRRRLLELSVDSRFVAVPLALTSASRSAAVALQFMLKEAEKQSQKQSGSGSSSDIPCLQVIHVIGVSDSLMELYRRRFPQSVVSTICAVDITGVSAHPDEQEVLLRGAFFQILSLEGPKEVVFQSIPKQHQHQQDSGDSQQPEMAAVTANVQEILVINANRDHLSNGRLGDQDAPARALFAAIVRVTRYGYCLNFCRERGMRSDEAEYAAALWESEQALQRLLA